MVNQLLRSIDSWRGRGLSLRGNECRRGQQGMHGMVKLHIKNRGQEPVSLQEYIRSATGRANSSAGASLQWQAKGKPALSR